MSHSFQLAESSFQLIGTKLRGSQLCIVTRCLDMLASNIELGRFELKACQEVKIPRMNSADKSFAPS